MKLKRMLSIAAAAMLAAACSVPQGNVIYVDCNAKPGGDGSRSKPFATIEQAQDAAKELQESCTPRSTTIMLADGIYHITSSLCFDEFDSGTSEDAPIIYKARHQGKAIISMGRSIPASSLQKVTDEAALRALKAEIAVHVRVCDLASIGITRAFKPLSDYQTEPEAPWLFAGGHMATPARWPDEGFATFTQIPDIGLAKDNINMPTVRNDVLSAFYFKDTCGVFAGASADARVNGYYYFDWFDESIRIAGYDAEKEIVSLAGSARYGIGLGGWALKYRRFYVSNSLRELDCPGEWYLDREKSLLYYYPASADDQLMLAFSNDPLMILDGTCNIRFEGITFGYTMHDGIIANDVENLQFVGCTIANICGTALKIKGNNCLVQSCDVHDIGVAGIEMEGGDRLALVESGNVIDNCHIWRFAELMRCNHPGVHLKGIGNTLSNCYIHDAPHMAILFSGNENHIVRNEIENVLYETSDAGAIYSGRDWTFQGNVIRNNYLHDIPLVDSTFVTVKGIYLDDGVCTDTVEFNILHRVPRAIMIGGGRDHTIRGNYLSDCIIGIYLDARGMEWAQWNRPDAGTWYFEGKAEEMHYRESPWKDKYQRLARIMQDDYKMPLYNRIQDNLIANTPNVTQYNPNIHPYLSQVDGEFSGNVGIVTREGVTMVPDTLGVKGYEYLYRLGQDIDPQQIVPTIKVPETSTIGLYNDKWRRAFGR